MAMDKEMLLQRLQSQYLTRQEVLFKLPLNISISTFWPELVERRKMNSIVLPLHRADGKPMWYVLTDKMIAASERLCALALDSATAIDPYKTAMTGAMTEEIFFTSFVEGAQITLQEAMEFLERGTEPENVQEQMIQNNRQAWTDMIRMLYYPLDERYVRMLAYRLTDEMEGQATDYRQTDTHPIAAMGKEAYDVPPAAAIPGLMQEYYDFLASTEIHPLIKAAVGQAYLLVTRPFPEGNERLSRMISYAVLLRSGYDFLRDISISGVIARESYRYFKSMQDIIRSENGGDLTYFIEYYLDLLARSIDAKAEQEQRRREEALLLERQAAKQPLARQTSAQAEIPVSPVSSPTEAIENPVFRPEDSVEISFGIEELDDSVTAAEAEPRSEPTESPPPIFATVEEYLAYLQDAEANRMGRTQPKRIERLITGLSSIARSGGTTFMKHDWEQLTETSDSIAKDDIYLMLKLGLILCETPGSPREPRVYHLLIRSENPMQTTNEDTEYDSVETETLRHAIRKLMESEYARERQSAAGLMDMLENGRMEFSFAEWMLRNPVANKDVGFGLLRVAMNYGFLEYEDGIYRFARDIRNGPKCYHMPDKQREVLLKLMDAFPDEKFTIRNASELTGLKYGTVGYYLDNFTQRGILKVTKALPNVNYYEFSSEVHGIFEATESDEAMTGFQQLPEQEKEIHNPLRGMAEVG